MKHRVFALILWLGLSTGLTATATQSSQDTFSRLILSTGATPAACADIAELRIAYSSRLSAMFARRGWGDAAQLQWQFCARSPDLFQNWLAKWQRSLLSGKYPMVAQKRYTREPWQYWLYCLSCRSQPYSFTERSATQEIWVEFYPFRQGADPYMSSKPAPGGLIRVGRLQ